MATEAGTGNESTGGTGGVGGDAGGSGGQGGFGGLGIGNPGSYGGQQSVGAPGFGGVSSGPSTGGYGAVEPGTGMRAHTDTSLGAAMAQSDIQAMQNETEQMLAANPANSLSQVANSMQSFTSQHPSTQQVGYSAIADNELSRDLSTRSLADAWGARQTAKKVGADLGPYSSGVGANVTGGLIDFAANKIPFGGIANKGLQALTGQSLGQYGVNQSYGDLSRQSASGDLSPESSFSSPTMGGPGDGGSEDKLLSLIERMNRPSAIVRGV